MEIRTTSSGKGTFELGVEIGSLLRPPRTILLYGPLGAGKTLFTQGLARGLGVHHPEQVRSPTFTLVNQYRASAGLIYHVDCYRLDGLRDFYSFGLDEILTSPAIVIVEWADRLLLEADRPLQIRIQPGPGPEDRRVEIWESPREAETAPRTGLPDADPGAAG